MIRTVALLALAASVLSACAHVPRTAATALSQSGVKATNALSADVDARVGRLRADRAAQDFVASYAILRTCPAVTHGRGSDPNCDTMALAAARAKNDVNVQIATLADVVALRSRALQALGGAYAALGDEAAYDAPGELDKAIAPALEAVNQFGAALGLGPLPSLVDEGIKAAGHALAARAQTRRLLRGSRQIAQITHHMRLALSKELATFALLDSLLADLDRQTRDAVLKAGILDTAQTVRRIASGAGVTANDPALDAALSADPVLRGAAEVATLDTLSPPSSGDLEAGVALLTELERQHSRFERGERPTTAEIAADIDRLAALAAALKQ